MGNGIAVYPADLMFDYRPIGRRAKVGRDKWVGFYCSLCAHLCLLILGGVAFIRPVEFGVDLGLSGMEVQLIAGVEETAVMPQEIIEEKPIIEPQESPVIPEEVIPEQIIHEPEPIIKEANLGNSNVNVVLTGQGAITEMQPSYLRNPAPRYPFLARQNGWEGTVVLDVRVNGTGIPAQVVVAQSSGHDVLDEAAAKTVRTWRFLPAKFGNLSIESSVKVPVRFRLEDFKGDLNL